jgi:iron complex transport system substrate-binding protein
MLSGKAVNLFLSLLVFLFLFWLFTVPLPSHIRPSQIRGAPQRIVSANLRSDEILLSLVNRDRLIAVSHLSLDPSLSNVAEEAKKIPHKVKVDPEMVYGLNPDLVVVGDGSSPDAVNQLRTLGITVFKTTRFDSLGEVQRAIVDLGKAVGEEKKAEALVSATRQRLDEVGERVSRAQHRPLVLYYSTGGYTGGRGTIVDDVIRAAGGRNLAAQKAINGYKKFSLEVLVMDEPEAILLGERGERERVLYQEVLSHAGLKQLKAVRDKRVYAIPSRHLVTSSHYIVEGVERLARLLHPHLFSVDPEN